MSLFQLQWRFWGKYLQTDNWCLYSIYGFWALPGLLLCYCFYLFNDLLQLILLNVFSSQCLLLKSLLNLKLSLTSPQILLDSVKARKKNKHPHNTHKKNPPKPKQENYFRDCFSSKAVEEKEGYNLEFQRKDLKEFFFSTEGLELFS